MERSRGNLRLIEKTSWILITHTFRQVSLCCPLGSYVCQLSIHKLSPMDNHCVVLRTKSKENGFVVSATKTFAYPRFLVSEWVKND